MKFRVYMKVERAMVKGERIPLYRVVMDKRENDWDDWVVCDNSLLYDTVTECQGAGEELQDLYRPCVWRTVP